MTYLNAKKYIYSSPDKSPNKKNNLLPLLEKLGNPQKRLKYVRFAGSNGKTVCAEMLRSIFKHTAMTLGCLRMPMREEPRDNICIDDDVIGMEEFSSYTSKVRMAAVELDLVLTRSEILAATAFMAFAKEGCNLCIVESNHFGDDPTLVLPPPIAVVICGAIPTGELDEIRRIRSYISRGIEEIVTAPQNDEAYGIISDTCYSANCRLSIPSRKSLNIEKLNFRGAKFTYKNARYVLNLCGRFQVSNAILVLEAVEMLNRRGYRISWEAVRLGLEYVKIPSKFEIISLSPLIIADSTHTPIAIDTVCDSFADFRAMTGSQVRLCLPEGEIIEYYTNALTSKGYEIENVFTLSAKAYDSEALIVPCKTVQSLVKNILKNLSRDTVLIISGTHEFVNPIRYNLLSVLGF